MKLPHYSANNVRYWLLTLAIIATACETTRDNTQQDKARTRTVICNVPDRCGMTP